MFLEKICLYTTLVCFFIIKPAHAAGDSCHPEIDTSKKQYIVGYGSLISERSKQATVLDTGPSIPIEVRGFKRGWFHLVKNHIYLGVEMDENQFLNGVLFSLGNKQDLKKFDKREIDYCRVSVPRNKIVALSDDKVDGQFWIYVTQQIRNKDEFAKTKGVAASYMYTFLLGCKEVADKFSLQDYLHKCTNQTSDWPSVIDYDLDNRDKLLKSRIVPKDDELKEINKLLCYRVPPKTMLPKSGELPFLQADSEL
jgi:hypothetical protein